MHGKELDPKTLWQRDWKCCLSIGGFFSGNITNIEFAKEARMFASIPCLAIFSVP